MHTAPIAQHTKAQSSCVSEILRLSQSHKIQGRASQRRASAARTSEIFSRSTTQITKIVQIVQKLFLVDELTSDRAFNFEYRSIQISRLLWQKTQISPGACESLGHCSV